MKTSTIRALALFGLIAALGPSAVMAEEPYHFKIPFGFNVGAKSFAPGEYRVEELLSHVVHIRSEDGHANIVFLGIPDGPGKGAYGTATLTFNRYGERYFLSKLSDSGGESKLPRSVGEKELIAQKTSPRPLDVVASSRR